MKQQRRSFFLRGISVLLLSGIAGCGGHGTTAYSNAIIPSTANKPVQSAPQALLKINTTQDWDSFGYDLQRTGYDPNETVVGPSNVGSLQQLWTLNVGSKPMREPVLATNVMIKGTSTNVLYFGSNYGSSLDAINASTGAIIWSHTVPNQLFTCGTTKEEWSVGATPAIDRQHGRIYFGDGKGSVHALSLATGAAIKGWAPISIVSSSYAHNNMHGGLTYNPANGMLYAVTSSICDWKPWNGRIVAIDTGTHSIAGTFYPVSGTSTPGGDGGGIWGGGGASIDPATNDVLIATGNASVSAGLQQNMGYAEHVVMLNANLSTILASNYPTNIPSMPSLTDQDFGSTPMVFTPPGCPEMLTALNKSGMFELYDVSAINSGPVQYIQMAVSNDNGDFQGEPVYDPVTNYVYVGMPDTFNSYSPGLAAFSIESNCTLNPTPVWAAQFGPDGASTSRATPRSAVSVANGVVYVSNGYLSTEFAFDASTGAQLWTTPLKGYGKIGTIVSNGIVYVSDDAGNMTAWAPPSGSARPKLRQLSLP